MRTALGEVGVGQVGRLGVGVWGGGQVRPEATGPEGQGPSRQRALLGKGPEVGNGGQRIWETGGTLEGLGGRAGTKGAVARGAGTCGSTPHWVWVRRAFVTPPSFGK